MLKPVSEHKIHTVDFKGQTFELLVSKHRIANQHVIEMTVSVQLPLGDQTGNIAIMPCMNERHQEEAWKMHNDNKHFRDGIATKMLEKISDHVSAKFN